MMMAAGLQRLRASSSQLHTTDGRQYEPQNAVRRFVYLYLVQSAAGAANACNGSISLQYVDKLGN